MDKPLKKKAGFYEHIIYPTLIMTLFAAVMTGVIAWLDDNTKGRIAELEALKVQATVLDVLNLSAEPQNGESPQAAIQRVYGNSVTATKTKDGSLAYVAKVDGKVTGVAFEMDGNALWGSVTGYFALSGDGKKLLGVNFTKHSETPGLGGRIDEAWFKDQFRNLPVTPGQAVGAYKPALNGNLDGISGASLTANAVLDMINKAVSDKLPVLSEVSQ